MTSTRLMEVYGRRFTASATIAGLVTIVVFGIFIAVTQPAQTEMEHEAPGVELPVAP